MELPKERPKDPRDWNIELKLSYALDRANKLIDKHPVFAEIWLKEVDRIQNDMNKSL